MIRVEYNPRDRQRWMSKGYRPCIDCGKMVQHATGRCLACRRPKCKTPGCGGRASHRGMCSCCRRSLRERERAKGMA